jgi:hypothetical protein
LDAQIRGAQARRRADRQDGSRPENGPAVSNFLVANTEEDLVAILTYRAARWRAERSNAPQ